LDRENLSPGKIYISDYVFDKELIYVGTLLNPQQFKLYKGIYKPLAAKVSVPVLVIYMQDSPQNCLERIHSRNRPYEQQIKLDFLQQLDLEYEKLFDDWKISPVIRVQTSQLDYSNNKSVEHLLNQIKYYIAEQKHSSCGIAAGKV
jgi:deoxyadenosine/deoxycytidine kinase